MMLRVDPDVLEMVLCIGLQSIQGDAYYSPIFYPLRTSKHNDMSKNTVAIHKHTNDMIPVTWYAENRLVDIVGEYEFHGLNVDVM
jgi:hypothetical protein